MIARTLFASCCLAASLGGGQVIFRSQTDTVVLDLLPTSRNRIIDDLRMAEVEVRDNGLLQTLTHFSADPAPLDVYLLLDTSSSLTEQDLNHLRQGARALASQLRPEDELKLVTFTQYVRLHGVQTADSLASTFDRLQPVGDTALHDALVAGFRLGGHGSRRPVVIAFSDGADTASWFGANDAEDAARLSWASFFAVTPRSSAQALLGRLADLSGGDVIEIGSDLAALSDSLLRILTRVRQRYLLAFTPSTSTPGWHELDVRVKRSNVRVVARRGYLRR
jgi:VWFA-related protein